MPPCHSQDALHFRSQPLAGQLPSLLDADVLQQPSCMVWVASDTRHMAHCNPIAHALQGVPERQARRGRGQVSIPRHLERSLLSVMRPRAWHCSAAARSLSRLPYWPAQPAHGSSAERSAGSSKQSPLMLMLPRPLAG